MPAADSASQRRQPGRHLIHFAEEFDLPAVAMDERHPIGLQILPVGEEQKDVPAGFNPDQPAHRAGGFAALIAPTQTPCRTQLAWPSLLNFEL